MQQYLYFLVGLFAVASCDMSPAATLGPLVQQYQDLIYAKQFDKLEDLYHPHAVMIIDGQPAPFYTPKNIFQQIQESRSKIGNIKTSFLKETYSGSGDIMMYENQWKISTGKIEMTGPYRAIWVKYNGRWVIYHEEFSQTIKHL
ncbi:unnamed protein product, partial [Mesorhabditis spiculigera]